MDSSPFYPDYRDSLAHNLHRIGQLIREETNKVLKKYDLTPEQWQVLVVLAHHNGLTPTELGEKTLRDKTTVSRILPALFRKGYLIKEAHHSDARSYIVRLDEEYMDFVENTRLEIKHNFDCKVFASLCETDRERLRDLIVRLRGELGDL
ncbi:MarR family winged helix-turn-helix transcriptional regulator [Brevibacillus dissolubilis]|uniref:MarR family winged helix-turn-helix transcriptional regulator n=1 Tax=Brevibacillus dissolubilis TaxID=1844116 RepID=UPI003F66009A